MDDGQIEKQQLDLMRELVQTEYKDGKVLQAACYPSISNALDAWLAGRQYDRSNYVLRAVVAQMLRDGIEIKIGTKVTK